MTNSVDSNKSHQNWVARPVCAAEISAIKQMAMLSAQVEGAASLTWGVPSFKTPEIIRRGVQRLLDEDDDIGKYTLPDGLPELRDLVVETHARETGITVDAKENVLITAGNMQGLSTLFRVIINPGDEIILTDPGFASHFQQIKLCDGHSVSWALNEQQGWALDVDALPALITEKTKAIVIVSPSNPTGKIFDEAQLIRVGEIARQHNILILLDDPYSNFTYENRSRHFNLASVKSLQDNLVYLFTFSKAYAMSGWRLGYMIMPAALKKQALKVHDANLICTPHISQSAGIVALSHPPNHMAEFEKILNQRRTLICQRLDRLPHIFEYVKPEGAYYVFPRIVAEHSNAWGFSIDLLHEAKVAVTPGSAFGSLGESHVRMAYCVPDETINLAFDRMEDYFWHG
ncbi:MAG: pyridoxal phosphate-dependent aminotransferase [Gammaproteobacteria bacterium]|nr:pyridoxal phosphate-dependent aminotransferase [Gammaproteobacteria bacterium]MBQ0841071.1 pyridoxal phosphate-dependent aminotransferase [Gammaproteobacteria bacterium]